MKSPDPQSELPVTGPDLGLGARCEEVLRSLPDWFGLEEAILEYRAAIDHCDTFIVEDEDKLVGFMSVQRHFDAAAELHVLAVRQEYHRCGLGRRLLAASEQHCRQLGVRFLQVKTLSPRRECEFYEKTRRFYEAMGFCPLEEFRTLWGEANPCLQMIKAL